LLPQSLYTLINCWRVRSGALAETSSASSAHTLPIGTPRGITGKKLVAARTFGSREPTHSVELQLCCYLYNNAVANISTMLRAVTNPV